jgi:DNA-binding response OmpR family regulator
MAEENTFTGATVLVVDDAPPNVKLLRLILNDAGYRVLEAASGPEALATLRRDKPDIMVLDVRMPGMTGYEVCRQIREDAEFSALPVIMVTALSSPEDRIRGIEAGATDFITKPFNKKELLARVKASLIMAKIGRNGIVAQLPGAVLIADPDWKVLALSPLASVLLDIPSLDIQELDFTQLLAPSEQAQLASGKELLEFTLQARSAISGKQLPIMDPAGTLIMRLITLTG